jgi:ATP-dependent Lon protease
MFPLGMVLVPGMVLPLHVFEPRYRQLVRDCLDGEGEFGVVLIERGSEVGGGDVRTDAGSMARIVQADELPDGRFVVGAVGVRRIRVERWLDDAPYPRALVADWPDPDGHASDVTGGPGLAEVAALLRRSSALHTELGEAALPLDLELSDDLLIASYQAAAVSPLGPVDKQALLCAPTLARRVEMLRDLLLDHLELLEARLSAG